MANKKKPSPTKAIVPAVAGRGLAVKADTLSELSPQQQVFALEYIKDWNGTRAALAAGYSEKTAYSQASRLLKNVEIQAFISNYVDAVAMPASEVLLRLRNIARGSLDPFIREAGEDVWPDLTTDKAKESRHLLKKIKPKRRTGGTGKDKWTETEIELEIHDPVRALELLGRHHKLFTDKTEITGADGGPIRIILEEIILKAENDDE